MLSDIDSKIICDINVMFVESDKSRDICFIKNLINNNNWENDKANVAVVRLNKGFVIIDRSCSSSRVFTAGNVNGIEGVKVTRLGELSDIDENLVIACGIDQSKAKDILSAATLFLRWKKSVMKTVLRYIDEAESGDPGAAANLLNMAVNKLNDQDDIGRIIRNYVQNCLKKFGSGDFLQDKLKGQDKKTIERYKNNFFLAFNLTRRPHRNVDTAEHHKKLLMTVNYIVYMLAGENRQTSMSLVKKQFKRYWSERNFDRVVDENKRKAQEKIKNEWASRYHILENTMNNLERFCWEKLSDPIEITNELKRVLESLRNKLKNELAMHPPNNDSILKILDEYLEKLKSSFPNKKELIKALETPYNYIKITDLSKLENI